VPPENLLSTLFEFLDQNNFDDMMAPKSTKVIKSNSLLPGQYESDNESETQSPMNMKDNYDNCNYTDKNDTDMSGVIESMTKMNMKSDAITKSSTTSTTSETENEKENDVMNCETSPSTDIHDTFAYGIVPEEPQGILYTKKDILMTV
jgi:hypothetical protein